jgi:hypothetical protein
MARKFLRAAVAKKRSASHDARAAVKPALCAHPRLVYGFLIGLAGRSAISPTRTKFALADVASVRSRSRDPAEMKCEGPADDAIFH